MNVKVIVVFCSPAGSTGQVAAAIKKRFGQRKAEVVTVNLGKTHDRSAVLEQIKTAGKHACLFIGSPVYMDRAVPPVIRFIEALPKMTGALAAPFVTWGGACSGLALWQLSDALIKKGFKIVGAAKVLAVHSRMWRLDDPAGKGHPNERDYRKIEELVDTLNSRFNADDVPVVDLDTLIYQPIERANKIMAEMDAPLVSTPKHVNIETCTQCGICEKECPAAAVVLNPYPEFGPNCFDCFNCIRLCPENAIESAISINKIEEHIRERVRTINERPLTQIFI